MKEYKELIKIGNSKGIIIPAEFLEYLKLDLKDVVRIDIELNDESGYLILSKIEKQQSIEKV